MNGLNLQDATLFVVSRISSKANQSITKELPSIIESFWQYDLRFMRQTGVISEDGNAGDNDYDDEEAFEYIFEAFLADFPQDDDAAMIIADLLDRYMELQYEYLQQCHLA